MTDFPLGMIALIVVSILIYFGVAHRVLDRLRLSDKAALAIIAAIIVGSFINIPVTDRVTINLGGVIAIGLAFYVLLGAGTSFEKIRAIIAAGVTGLTLFILSRFLGAEPEQIIVDPLYMYAIVAGIVGYLAGRSRRGAFFAAVIGVLTIDIAQYIWLTTTGVRGTVFLGGAGAFDALILAGILAVLLAEVVGETLERIQGGPKTEGRDPNLIEHLKEPQPSKKPSEEEQVEEQIESEPESEDNSEGDQEERGEKND
ncbi:hypothetical protein SYNTR_1248 [Candidatus Syntrophocurvum alkaliphilum]|uniref:DUF1614 domain-containing protein n=1 Tax=Candidatus Syntrophocurvum alkaliphilum TaxID=2293317 RepID=A0A6I6DKM9_9FIRM|nr:DUF1614 domain-containing protein [Candidatus Syntrophocurvum alkaliphilum]QGT99841.1 hypothetical protein SYNTR_1248 [Candidatus Syntrophocurvum alkaliphilum]